MNDNLKRKPIRVIVVDDHPLLREGTQASLECAPDIEVVGAAGEGRIALALVDVFRPDVLLLDLRLPDVSGVEVARQVLADCPEVAVLILTGYDDVQYTRELLQQGVRGYLRKTASGEDLVAAVRTLASGGTVVEPDVARMVIPGGSAAFLLSEREYEVLRLLVAGHRNSEIANRLRVSVNTIEFHVGKLLRKLRVRSRAEAIVKAQQDGLLLPVGAADSGTGEGQPE